MNSTNSTSGGNDLASIASKEVGYHEYSKNGKSNGNKYGASFGNNFARWCEYFVSWVSKKAGLSGKTYLGGSVGDAMQWFKNHNMFGEKGSYTPQRNDTVIFKTGRSHAAIVEKVENGKIYTIEGNTGTNNVARRSYSLNERTITGYGKTSKYFSGSSGTTTKTVKLSKEQIDYIKQLVTNYNTSDKALVKSMVIKKYGEKQGKKINDYIDSFAKFSDVKKSLEELKTKLVELNKELWQLYIDRADKYKELYEAEAENALTPEKKNKYLAKQMKYIKQSYHYQILQAQEEKDWVQIATLRAQKYKEILDLQKQMMQNVQDRADERISLLDARNEYATDKKTKQKNYKKEAKIYEQANKDIETKRKEAVKKENVKKNTEDVTKANMSDKGSKIFDSFEKGLGKTNASKLDDYLNNGGKLSKSLEKKLKKQTGLTKEEISQLNQYLNKGSKVPAKLIKKIKKKNPSLAKKLEDYNKQWNKTSKADQKEYKKQINESAEKQTLANDTAARQAKIDSLQLDVDEADSQISALDAQKSVARDEKGVASAKEKNKYLKEQVKWINQSYDSQIAIAKLEGDSIKVKELEAKKQEELLNNQIEQRQNIADEAEETVNLYEAQAENVSTSKQKIELYKKELEPLKTQYENLIKIAEESGKATEAERLRTEYTAKNAENLRKQFDAISGELNNRNSLFDNGINYLQAKIDTFEALGDAINTDIYSKMMEYSNGESANIEAAIQDQLDYINGTNGKEQVKGENFYHAMEELTALYEQLEKNKQQNAEWQKAINEINLKPYEKLSDRLSYINDEFNFMLKAIQSGNDLFDKDSGAITNAGMASLETYFDQMDIAESRAENISNEMAKVKKMYESGEMSLKDYTEKTEELTRSLWDQKSAVIETKEAIVDMVKQGLDAQLNALDKMIDKYKKALSNEKDLYEYQKNIAKQTKNITTIKNQLETLSGDDSEEARAKVQKLQVQLDEAEEELRDTEYNKWYEDQNNMLDNLRNEISDEFENIMKDTDKIIQNVGDSVNKSISQNGDYIKKFSDKINYKPTEDFESITTNQESVQSVSADIYNKLVEFQGTATSIKDLMDNFVQKMAESTSAQYGSDDGGNGVLDTISTNVEKIADAVTKPAEFTVVDTKATDEQTKTIVSAIENNNPLNSTNTSQPTVILSEPGTTNGEGIPADGLTAKGTDYTVSQAKRDRAKEYINKKLTTPKNDTDKQKRIDFAKKHKAAARIKHQFYDGKKNGKMIKDMSELVHLARIFDVVAENTDDSKYKLSSEQEEILYNKPPCQPLAPP